MNCPHCRKELAEGQAAPSCPQCGRELVVEQGSPQPWHRTSISLFVLAVPALLTMMVALFRQEVLSTWCVLLASPAAGIFAGIVAAKKMGGNIVVRVLLAIVLSAMLTFVCLISCFFGCVIAGGGGVRIGG